MRHAARTDVNQPEIVAALRERGATVWVIGLPVDLLVGYEGVNTLMEIKPSPKKQLTKLQTKFFDDWRGQVARVETVEQAFEVAGINGLA